MFIRFDARAHIRVHIRKDAERRPSIVTVDLYSILFENEFGIGKIERF